MTSENGEGGPIFRVGNEHANASRIAAITTKAVKASDLLLCEKAFAHTFIDLTVSFQQANSFGVTRSFVRLLQREAVRSSPLCTVSGKRLSDS